MKADFRFQAIRAQAYFSSCKLTRGVLINKISLPAEKIGVSHMFSVVIVSKQAVNRTVAHGNQRVNLGNVLEKL